MLKEVAVLLVGDEAVALAPRLQTTGYLTLDWSAGAAALAPAPRAGYCKHGDTWQQTEAGASVLTSSGFDTSL